VLIHNQELVVQDLFQRFCKDWLPSQLQVVLQVKFDLLRVVDHLQVLVSVQLQQVVHLFSDGCLGLEVGAKLC